MPGTIDYSPPVNAKADAPTENSIKALERNCQNSSNKYFPSRRELWFAQLEAQFTLVNLPSDARKFNLVIAHLDPSTAPAIQGVTINKPQGNAYVRLKEELISRLAPSRDTQIRQKLDREQIGDRKPSQFLQRLKDLAGGTMTDDALKTESTTSFHTNKLSAHLAPKNPSFLSLSQKVELLPKQVEAMHMNRGDQNRRLKRSRSRSRAWQHRNPTPTSIEKKNNDPTGFCYFHRKWGSKARNCNPLFDFNQQAGNENGCH
ncbi:uncharacterized protein LOC129945186 [Eupeodes corollae]|uniref:uncharacterized protein LOC129945186 n=1 Tax=Eupeodes corollae TaxID=290404 RepID=UPI0024935F2A|nr:uncharacterized protein LOC129945186 [Eupeodes corollae]